MPEDKYNLFECPDCGKWNPDYFTGPDGHFVTAHYPKGPVVYEGCEVCYCCWLIRWELRKWERSDKYAKFAYLLSRGWKQTEIAHAMGFSTRTLRRWRKKIAQNQSLVSALGAPRVRTQ